MTADGDMTSRPPDGDETLKQLLVDVFNLVDETVAQITGAEVNEHLRKVLSKSGSSRQLTDLWQARRAAEASRVSADLTSPMGEGATEAGERQKRISVFLVVDHEMFRRGIRILLSSEPDIDVVGEAGTAAAALTQMPALRPDVAVLGFRLPDGDGISVCREISSALPQTACLMFPAYGDDQPLLGTILAGAAGYVTTQTCGTNLVSALRAVASGLSILEPQESGQVMASLRQRAVSMDPAAALSEREKKMLELIGEGLTNRQIAQRMFLAEKTVKNYVSSLLTKLGMQRRTQAAAFAVRHSDDR